MENTCIMNKKGHCSGYNFATCIGLENCKYGKTRLEQEKLETKIVDGIRRRMPYLYRDVRSIARTGKVLIWADDHNKLRTKMKEK